ncbi:hypothetical protein MFIFM68171_07382 [Madurella fahalii]|uniref:Uncharacterized protein n=1 Tax=Madurella fahalii TaxID=1157608 RepID=A0ABQ0GHG3_9PEZI
MPRNPIMNFGPTPAFVLRFNLTNQANGVTYTCDAGCTLAEELLLSNSALTQLTDSAHEQDDHAWCSCVRRPPPADTNDRYFEWTSIRFDPYRRSLSVAQTWYCNDTGSRGPVQFTASGKTTDVPLSPEDCVERPATEPDWVANTGLPIGGSVPIQDGFTCNGISAFNITGAIASQHKMEQGALQLPKPVRRSCTASSLGLVNDSSALIRYSIRHFGAGYYDPDDSGYRNIVPGNGSTGGFALDLSGGFTGSIQCTHGGQPGVGGVTYFGYRCGNQLEFDSAVAGNLSAVWDSSTHILKVDISWACNDKNRDTP